MRTTIIEEVRARFNDTKGCVRVIAFLSPT